jgi:hypothetical protein
MKILEAPKIRFPDIRKRADGISAGFKDKSMPLNISDALEFDLGFEIIPAKDLLDGANTHALLYNNAKKILIDKEYYLDKRQQNVVRFTLAHELGHYYLHEHYRSFKKIEDWISFQNEVSSSDLNWFEAQADEFAGRLLVPLDMLKECVKEEVIPHLKRFARKDIDSDNVLEAAAGILFDKCNFGIPTNNIAQRLRREGVWESVCSSLR